MHDSNFSNGSVEIIDYIILESSTKYLVSHVLEYTNIELETFIVKVIAVDGDDVGGLFYIIRIPYSNEKGVNRGNLSLAKPKGGIKLDPDPTKFSAMWWAKYFGIYYREESGVKYDQIYCGKDDMKHSLFASIKLQNNHKFSSLDHSTQEYSFLGK